MIPKLKKYSFFAACSRVFNITESAFINTVFPIILPPASHYLGAFGTCTRQSAHGAQTKKRTDFSIPFSAPADFFTNSIFLLAAKLRYLSETETKDVAGTTRRRRRILPAGFLFYAKIIFVLSL